MQSLNLTVDVVPRAVGKVTRREVIPAPANPQVGDTLQFDGERWVAAPPRVPGQRMLFELDPFGDVGAHVAIECVQPGATTVLVMETAGGYFYTIPAGLPQGTTIEFHSTSPGVQAQFMLDDDEERLRGAVVGCTGVISSWRTNRTNQGKQDYRQFRIRKKYGHGAHLVLTKTSSVAPQWSLSGVCPRSNAGIRFEPLEGSAEASDDDEEDEEEENMLV